jgi:CubicO group peptidase (beta-lactamase class C family)
MTDLSRRELIGAAIAAGAAGSVPALAAAAYEEAPSALFRRRVVEAGLPGAAAVLIRPGESPQFLCAGHASLPFQVSVTPSTLFHTGSVGKHVTSVAVLRLVDAGRMDLAAPIGRYSTIVPKAWRDVPLGTLLAHTSGIPDYGGGIAWDRPFRRAEFIADAADRPLDFVPGTAWNYCNAAYTLAGYLLEDVTGQSYRALIADLFARAGLRDSRVDDGEAVIPLRAEPYEKKGSPWVHATPMSSTISSVAAGGILMSPRDIPVWKAALAGNALLSPASRAAMATPFPFASGRPSFYNMGWVIDAMPDGAAFLVHTGSVSGFRCFHFESRKTGISMMLYCNAETDAHPAIGMELTEAFAPGSTPLCLPPLADSVPELTAAARAILFRDGPLALAPFAPEMRTRIEQFGEEAVESYRDEPSRPAAFVLVQEMRVGRIRRRHYRLSFERRRVFMTIDYTDGNLIYAVRAL